jgi:hypothetical protein
MSKSKYQNKSKIQISNIKTKVFSFGICAGTGKYTLTGTSKTLSYTTAKIA